METKSSIFRRKFEIAAGHLIEPREDDSPIKFHFEGPRAITYKVYAAGLLSQHRELLERAAKALGSTVFIFAELDENKRARLMVSFSVPA